MINKAVLKYDAFKAEAGLFFALKRMHTCGIYCQACMLRGRSGVWWDRSGVEPTTCAQESSLDDIFSFPMMYLFLYGIMRNRYLMTSKGRSEAVFAEILVGWHACWPLR